MPDEPTPAGNPGDAGQDNATIRHLRAQIEAAQKEAKEAKEAAAALAAEKKERERAELTELERLKAEKADHEQAKAELEALRNERGQFVSTFQALYEAELEGAPEAARERLGKLSARGSWAERFADLREAKALLASATPPAEPTPAVAGSRTQPPSSTQPPPTGPRAPEPLPPINVNERQGIGSALKRPAPVAPV